MFVTKKEKKKNIQSDRVHEKKVTVSSPVVASQEVEMTQALCKGVVVLTLLAVYM